VSGTALDAILVFFAALVQADGQIATHIVPSLVTMAEKAPKAESSPGNVAKCVAQVVKTQQAIAAGTIAEFSKHIKVRSFCLD
jgi:cullin-associated NEDD8-dissociated protein 1